MEKLSVFLWIFAYFTTFCRCVNHVPMDLMIAFEDSDYVAPDDTAFQKSIAQRFFETLAPQETSSRVALTHFSTEPHTILSFQDTSNYSPDVMNQLVGAITHVGGKTCTNLVLKQAKTAFFDENSASRIEPKILLLVMQSPENCVEISTTMEDAQYLMFSNVLIFAVGVGQKIDKEYLTMLSGYAVRTESYPDYVAMLNNIKELISKLSMMADKMSESTIKPADILPDATTAANAGSSSESAVIVPDTVTNPSSLLDSLDINKMNHADSTDPSIKPGSRAANFLNAPDALSDSVQTPAGARTDSAPIDITELCPNNKVKYSGCTSTSLLASCFPFKVQIQMPTDHLSVDSDRPICKCASEVHKSGHSQFVITPNGDCWMPLRSLKRRSLRKRGMSKCYRETESICHNSMDSFPVVSVSMKST